MGKTAYQATVSLRADIQQVLGTEPDTLYAWVLRCQRLCNQLHEVATPDVTPTVKLVGKRLETMRQTVEAYDRMGLSAIIEELFRCRLLVTEAWIRGRLRLVERQEGAWIKRERRTS